MENNDDKFYATVEWYDSNKGFGIASHDELLLVLHSSYLVNKFEKLDAADVISCVPKVINDIHHATNIIKVPNIVNEKPMQFTKNTN